MEIYWICDFLLNQVYRTADFDHTEILAVKALGRAKKTPLSSKEEKSAPTSNRAGEKTA